MSDYTYRPLSEDIRKQRIEARYQRDLEAAEALALRLSDYLTVLRRRTATDFEELKVCNAIVDLFDDGDVVGRRDAILEENRWDDDGNPLRDGEPRLTSAEMAAICGEVRA